MENPSKGIFHIHGAYNSVLRTCCICNTIKPDYVHVMAEGKIVRSGGPELAHELEKDGYEFLKEPALA